MIQPVSSHQLKCSKNISKICAFPKHFTVFIVLPYLSAQNNRAIIAFLLAMNNSSIWHVHHKPLRFAEHNSMSSLFYYCRYAHGLLMCIYVACCEIGGNKNILFAFYTKHTYLVFLPHFCALRLYIPPSSSMEIRGKWYDLCCVCESWH